MNNRLKLGVIFNFSPSWMGGIIYILNIIKTLNFLDEDEKPQIKLFYHPQLKKFIDEVDYPYIEFIEVNFPSIYGGHIKSWLLRKNVFVDNLLRHNELDVLYPIMDGPVRTKTNVKLVSWFADFQYKYYPNFFTKNQLRGRVVRSKNILKNIDEVVLSSKAAESDLRKFYKLRPEINTHVYNFVSILDDLKFAGFEVLKAKYGLPDNYFLISNQFHRHKNHRVVFESIGLLKKAGVKINIAITGKFPNQSESPYILELKGLIEKFDLDDQINMLGVISRADQVEIMKNAQAVIQPSLFEGWSTVIEDAKSLQVPVIASNLNVNIEQLQDAAVYFDPNNTDTLNEVLRSYQQKNDEKQIYEVYDVRVKKAAQILLSIFKS